MPKTQQDIELAAELIENKIYLIRGEKVMLDRDLAKLYGVPTFRLNEQVRRNIKRFPGDFMFQLDFKEYSDLISQFAISSRHGGTRKMPLVFTENGVAMLSSVLNSERAILVNVQIMRIFTRIRKLLSSHKELLNRLEKLEARVAGHDQHIIRIFEAIRQILDLPVTLKRKSKPMGFIPPRKDK